MFKRTADNKGTVFEPKEETPFDLAGAVPLEVPAGTLVLLHAAFVHYRCAAMSCGALRCGALR